MGWDKDFTNDHKTSFTVIETLRAKYYVFIPDVANDALMDMSRGKIMLDNWIIELFIQTFSKIR